MSNFVPSKPHTVLAYKICYMDEVPHSKFCNLISIILKVKFISYRFSPVLATIFLCLLGNALVAQNFIYSGKVIDKQTKMPVANVNIQVLSKKNQIIGGVSTDSKGYFQLTGNEPQITIKLSHVSYRIETVHISYKKTKENPQVITLTPKSYTLKEVNINNKKIEKIYAEHQQSVLDYEIYKNKIFYIVKDFSDFSIKLYSCDISLNHTVQIKPPDIPKQFFVDLFGNLDFVSKRDSAYQMFVSDDTVLFYKPIPFNSLLDKSNMYKFKINDKFYFSEFSDFLNDKLNFGYITTNNKRKIFYSVYDDNKVFYYYMEMRFLKIISRGYPPEQMRQIVKRNYNNPALYFDRNFLYTNIYEIFFKVNQTIYIIDNIHNKLISFNEKGLKTNETTMSGNSENSSNINALLNRKGGQIWKSPVIIDRFDSTKIYLPVKSGTKSKLFSLNLQTGIIHFVKTIPAVYPEKLRIYNRKLYFLYEKTGSLRSYGLYKTNL